MIQEYPTLKSTDDRPGAFAIQTIPDEENDWDPTKPQEVMQETSGNDQKVSVIYSSYVADETLTTQGQEKKKRRCLLFLVALICWGVAGALVGVLLWGKQGAAASSGEETPPSFVECENSTDPVVQCEVCSQPIRVSDAVQDMYNSLKANEELAEHLDNDTQIESCTPANMALLWLASEVAEVMVTQESVDLLYEHVSSRFLLAFLYFAWDGRNWKDNRNWLSSDSECDWHGVGCNENGKIESLSLLFNNIKGSLESRLGLLSTISTARFPFSCGTSPVSRSCSWVTIRLAAPFLRVLEKAPHH
jgi:hypothetical protein